MSVKIRLTRMGRHRGPFYRVVVADSRFARDGRYIEQLGFYNPSPVEGVEGLKINEESALNWLVKGAQPSDSVKTLFTKYGLMQKAAAAKKGK